MAVDCTLKRTEMNSVLQLLTEFGFDPLEFDWSEEEQNEYLQRPQIMDRYKVSTLTHRSSGYYIVFGGMYVRFSPGLTQKVESHFHNNQWDAKRIACIGWLSGLKNEVDASDLWTALRNRTLDGLHHAERANAALTQAESQTAASELREASADLSRQPPDLTGAVQHSLTALECVAREHCSDHATFGKLLQRYDGLFPKPLDKGIEKIWGFASEMGRHLQEGRTPNGEEAELLVGLATACCTYLARKGRPVG